MNMDYEPIKEDGKVVGVTLTITFDPKPKPSKSGKTLIDFSTGGNKKVQLEGYGEVSIGLNIYHK